MFRLHMPAERAQTQIVRYICKCIIFYFLIICLNIRVNSDGHIENIINQIHETVFIILQENGDSACLKFTQDFFPEQTKSYSGIGKQEII